MLSAAHILAMDAKNLLDVIDSIRIRFPYVDNQICQRNNDVFSKRGSGQECRMRSSQSGEQLLRRSQSSERQSYGGFRQSQSGELLHRMGQSVDRGSQVSYHPLNVGSKIIINTCIRKEEETSFYCFSTTNSLYIDLNEYS